MKLSVGIAIIAKNEMEFIARALESVKSAEQIVVVDTGSTDNGETVRIAKEYTSEVYEDFTWNDRYCDARNHVKAKMKTDWILSLDCDEYIVDFAKVYEAIEVAESKGIRAIDVTQIAEDTGQLNAFPRLFKNDPDITWNGAIHNHLSITGTLIGKNEGGYFTVSGELSPEQMDLSLVKLVYGYSLAHLGDPDRTLRILEKEVNGGTGGAREKYYLAREYFYRRRYPECTAMAGRYVQETRFLAEKADGFLMMARAYWAQRMADDARDACAQAIIINPDFKEALMFMSELSWPRQGARWKSFAELATNEGVLFIRK